MPQQLSVLTFEIDHIIALKHNGRTEESNLALSCFYCNSYKGPNIAGFDHDRDQIVRLYHPRRDDWNAHFEYRGVNLIGVSDVGAVTIQVLNINHSEMLAMRDAFVQEGVFPYAVDQ